ncbi:AsmA-like C-terminal region-containing protein, partial [Salmonella enterica subsp. enterica serovar 1,4,[5],12:i:-]
MTLPISSNLYAGCLAGPAVCAGIFVVERIWGDKLDKTTTMAYQVSGSWEDPRVKEVEGMFE